MSYFFCCYGNFIIFIRWWMSLLWSVLLKCVSFFYIVCVKIKDYKIVILLKVMFLELMFFLFFWVLLVFYEGMRCEVYN